ncbi:MAG TPA: hypothetical protein VKB86_07880, partial [Pyrinomonadaceae bacterium]|nr:hypothetical protein [Pyrinomonadaceae bacterium]
GEVIKESSSIGEVAPRNVARGMTIIDPDQAIWDLAKIPGMNPDFISALLRCKAADAAWLEHPNNENHLAQMTCNKYSDGSYILPFSQPRGLSNSAIKEVGSARRSTRIASSNIEGMPLSSSQPTVSSSNSDKMAGSVSARKPSDIKFRSTDTSDMWAEFLRNSTNTHSHIRERYWIGEFDGDLTEAERLFQQFKTIIAGRTITWSGETINPDEVTLAQVYKIDRVTKEEYRNGQKINGGDLWRGDDAHLLLTMDPKDETHWKWDYFDKGSISDDLEEQKHQVCLGELKITGPRNYTNQCQRSGRDWNESVEMSLQVVNGQLQARITTTSKGKSLFDGSIEQNVAVETVTAHFFDAWAWRFR